MTDKLYDLKSDVVERLTKVIDEHMEAIKTFYPKEYASVLEKIRSLK